VRLWDPETGKELACQFGHDAVIEGLCFTPDGRGVLTTSDDGTVRLWALLP
jgi:WD40 repeat protein